MAVNTEKKVMKEARPPQQISPQTWMAVEAAICIGGLGYSEASRKFNVSPHAIMLKLRAHVLPGAFSSVEKCGGMWRGQRRSQG
jgi:hypothetical protein